jgi:REP element-mobilizing transposase RayT
MADSYSQIYIQTVFAVKFRNSLISPSWEDQLYKYITGAVQNQGQKMLAINGMPDHVHLFIGMKPNCSLSDLVREIKKSSSKFIKEKKLSQFKFQWQTGFGAFSYGRSQMDDVINYIANQKEHHRKMTFLQEYELFLKKYEVDYKTDRIFSPVE